MSNQILEEILEILQEQTSVLKTLNNQQSKDTVIALSVGIFILTSILILLLIHFINFYQICRRHVTTEENLAVDEDDPENGLI